MSHLGRSRVKKQLESYIYLEIVTLYCFPEVHYHFFFKLFALSVIVSPKGGKKNELHIFGAYFSGICSIAYRCAEVWHACLFIDVSSGQIYFVKRAREGKINRKHSSKTAPCVLQSTRFVPFLVYVNEL